MKSLLPTLLILLFFTISCSASPPTSTPDATQLPESDPIEATQPPESESAATEAPTDNPVAFDGQSLLQDRCTACHGLDRIESATKTDVEWKATIERMVVKGATLTDEEIDLLSTYLAETYP